MDILDFNDICRLCGIPHVTIPHVTVCPKQVKLTYNTENEDGERIDGAGRRIDERGKLIKD